MISVRNHRLQLNGSKLIFLLGFLLFIAACSPKIKQVAKPEEKEKPAKKPVVKIKEEQKTPSIALLLPFKLNKLSAKITVKQVNEATLALDFYQGFKLALDSLSLKGDEFRLEVFDSQDNDTRVVNLAMASSVTDNDVIIGPIFPDGIKSFGEFASLNKKVQVSPLAASMPSQFNNPTLVSLTNSIEMHGYKVADFIIKNYKGSSSNFIMVNTRKTVDEKFASPVRKYLSSLSKNTLTLKEVSGSAAIDKVLDANKTNIIILTSTEKSFVTPVIDKLYKLSSQNNVKIQLFGHPEWIKAQNMDTEKLQWLNTHITSSYFVDFKDTDTRNFISKYHDEFNLEPSEYSFKGFDCGYYFGKLLAEYGTDYVSHLADTSYKGLQNTIRLGFDQKLGFQNTELHMLQYIGFSLQSAK